MVRFSGFATPSFDAPPLHLVAFVETLRPSLNLHQHSARINHELVLAAPLAKLCMLTSG